MTRSVLADTGPLYAAVDPDDIHHRRAHDDLKRLAREKRAVIVPYPTLLEAHSLVMRRLGRATASVWLDEILKSSAPANPSAEDYSDGVMRLAALPDQAITLCDATLAALGARLKIEIWTYDHHFDVMRAKVWR
ncbi:MAG: PIN domain-containing protein [Candidatus Korobacteraceae bacterium]